MSDEVKNQDELDNAPTETTQGGDTNESASASNVAVSDNLASNVVSKTTNDIDQSGDQDLDDARATALRNHAVEHMNDPTPKTGDKTRV